MINVVEVLHQLGLSNSLGNGYIYDGSSPASIRASSEAGQGKAWAQPAASGERSAGKSWIGRDVPRVVRIGVKRQ